MNKNIFFFVLLCFCFASIASAENPKIDPKADKMLRGMSDLLAEADAFSFSTTETHDRHKRSGKTEQLQFSRQLVLKRPDGLWIQATGAQGGFATVTYDGKLLTLQSDAEKVYSQVEVPPTLDGAIDYAATHLDIPMPMADIFYSSPYEALITTETQGRYAKSEKIEGTDCALLEFQSPEADWRIWIAEQAQPVLCQLEITYKQEPGTPKSLMTFRNWNFTPQVEASKFRHVAPDGYDQIPILGYADQASDQEKDQE